jgi:hypothetical protein
MPGSAGPLLAVAEVAFACALLAESYAHADLRPRRAAWDAWFAALFAAVMLHGSLRSRAGARGGA